ncbi:hypothetical protein ABH925_006795 [Streptacidiphilus sp. EB129]
MFERLARHVPWHAPQAGSTQTEAMEEHAKTSMEARFKAATDAAVKRIRVWHEAEVYFIEAQKIDDRVPRLQTSASVRFEGAWLHLRLDEDQSKVVTVPAHRVSRVEWTVT